MKFAKLASLFVIIFQFVLPLKADEVSGIVLSNDRRVGTFYAGGEVASLTSPIESLFGYGLQVGYQYVLTGRYSVDAALSQLYGSSSGGGSGLTALYSGIVASFRWAPWKEFSQRRSDILFEGRRIFEEVASNEGVYAFGVQMNQLFLNGTDSVYNATGLGVVGSYDTKLYGRLVRYEARYAMMTANSDSLTGLFFNLVTPF